jgi:hypothetical protein
MPQAPSCAKTDAAPWRSFRPSRPPTRPRAQIDPNACASTRRHGTPAPFRVTRACGPRGSRQCLVVCQCRKSTRSVLARARGREHAEMRRGASEQAQSARSAVTHRRDGAASPTCWRRAASSASSRRTEHGPRQHEPVQPARPVATLWAACSGHGDIRLRLPRPNQRRDGYTQEGKGPRSGKRRSMSCCTRLYTSPLAPVASSPLLTAFATSGSARSGVTRGTQHMARPARGIRRCACACRGVRACVRVPCCFLPWCACARACECVSAVEGPRSRVFV